MAKAFGTESPEGVKPEILERMGLDTKQREQANLGVKIKKILEQYLPADKMSNQKFTGDTLEEFELPIKNQKLIKTTDGLFLEMTMGNKIKFYQKLESTTFDELKTKITETLSEDQN